MIDPALLRGAVSRSRLGEFVPPSSGPPSRSGAEMADAVADETPPAVAVDAPNAETSEGGRVEKDEAGSAEPETEERSGGVETKMEAAEAGEEEKPAASTDRRAKSEEEEEAAAATIGESRYETTAAAEERQPCLRSAELGGSEPADDSRPKEAKEEPGEDIRCSGMECEKSKAVCEDGDKPGGSGGAGAELDNKRRPSLEISSSDGEPLSRMDSEDRWVRGVAADGGAVPCFQAPVLVCSIPVQARDVVRLATTS